MGLKHGAIAGGIAATLVVVIVLWAAGTSVRKTAPAASVASTALVAQPTTAVDYYDPETIRRLVNESKLVWDERVPVDQRVGGGGGGSLSGSGMPQHCINIGLYDCNSEFHVGCDPTYHTCGNAANPSIAREESCRTLYCQPGYCASIPLDYICWCGQWCPSYDRTCSMACLPFCTPSQGCSSSPFPYTLPDNANWGTCTSGPSDSYCQLGCNLGYYAVPGSVDSGYCPPNACNPSGGVGGVWSIPVGAIQCAPVPCSTWGVTVTYGDPGSCTNGVYGNGCTALCQSGYYVSGDSSGYCGSDGAWHVNAYTCQPAYCGAVGPSDSNANVGSCGSAPVTSTCGWACNAGYYASTYVSGYCYPNGYAQAVWGNMQIGCSYAYCGQLPASYPQTYGSCTAGGTQGSTCSSSCADGYIPSGGGFTCTVSGNSASYQGTYTTCTLASCPPASAPSGGNIGNCGSAGQNSYCDVACNNGYAPSGSSQMHCQACSGACASWVYTGSALTCSALTCATPGLPSNANYNGCGWSNAALGTVCSFACNPGYAPSGNNAGQCVGSGASAFWSGQAITCSASYCPTYTSYPANANSGNCGNLVLGSQCNLGCNDGYSVGANPTGTCDASGPNAVWNNLGSFYCSPVYCGALSPGYPATQGSCSTQVLYTYCNYGCADGYSPSSAVQARCVPTSGPAAAWSPPPSISCSAVYCAAVSSFPANANAGSCGTLILTSQCTLGCNNGFSASSVGTGTCVPQSGANAAWSGLGIVCSSVPCPGLSVSSPQTQGSCYSQGQGASCNLGCVDGYSINSPVAGSCTADSGPNASWKNAAVSCQPVNCAAVTSFPAAANVGTCTLRTLNSVCQLACNDGYAPSGIHNGNCNAGTGPTAGWSGQDITCTASPCAQVTGLGANIIVGTCTAQPLNSHCFLDCANGYQGSSAVQGTCSPDSGASTASWKGMSIVCSAVSCAPMTPTLPIVVGTCTSKVLSSTCALACTSGYSIVAGSVVNGNCNAQSGPNAAWANAVVQCTPDTCPQFSPLPANSLINDCGVRSISATCTLTCQPGYVPSNVGTGTCNYGGTWSGITITCTAATCGAAAAPSGGNAGSCTAGVAQGNTCNLACNNGYSSSSPAQGTCSADAGASASWKNQALTCTPVSCSPVTSLSTGQLVGSCTTNTLGQTCNLACDNGYSPSASNPGTCSPLTGPNASWQNQALTCTAVNCAAATPSLPQLVHDCTNRVLFSTCTYTCTNGYSASGTQTGTCNPTSGANAVWQNQNVVCTPVSCSPATVSAPGAVGTCTNQVLNSVCNLDCQGGYQIVSQNPGTCTAGTGATASWVGQTISCTPGGCSTYTGYPTNANAGNCTSIAVGAICILGCNNGYIRTAWTYGACQFGGVWSNPSVTCTAALCPAAGAPAFGTIGSCTANAAQGATCNLACNDGYSSGSSSVQGTCSLDAGPSASWKNQAITCSPVSCVAVTGLGTGVNVGTCTSALLLSTCNLACNSGYAPSGSNQGTCTATTGPAATWQNQQITCTAATCPAVTGLPVSINVGTCTAGAALAATCALQCANGYSPSGSVGGTCSPITGQPTASWQNQFITCTPVSCSPVSTALPVQVGTCTSMVLGSNCQLACQSGYSIVGGTQTTGSCTAGSGPTASWTGASISCTSNTCPDLTSFPANANVGNCTTQNIGAPCAYACNGGYIRTAFTYATCQYGGTWTVPSITCTAATCPAATAPNNGNINTCTAGATQGSTCAFACNDGYSGSGASGGTCSADAGPTASWKNAALICSPVSCSPFTGLTTGQAVGTCTTNGLGALCALDCQNGYQPSGSVNGRCNPTTGPNAAWSGQSITCTPVSCAPATGIPANANTGNCTTQVLGSLCKLGCANGYQASGYSYGVCVAGSGATASWTSQSISCTPVNCAPVVVGAPTAVGNCTSQVLNSICALGCVSGYAVASMSYGVCVAGTGPTASWSGNTVSCTPTGCIPYQWTLPAHATINNCTAQPIGSTCTLGCADGYQKSSVGYATCQVNGNWTTTSIVCTASTCAAASAPLHGTVGTCSAGASMGALCDLACNDGYQGSAAAQGTCSADIGQPTASWKSQALTCSPVSCAALTSFSVGVAVGSCGSLPLLSTCSLTCLNGYSASGANQGLCTATTGPNASWQNQALTCTPMSCSTPGANPVNALSGNCTTAVLFSTCLLTCSNGYVPSGVVAGQCLPNGASSVTWQNQLITCSAAYCSAFSPLPANAAIGTCGSVQLNTVCQLNCNTGYSGTSTIGTCTAGTGPVASWSNVDITCTPASCVSLTPGGLPGFAAIGTCTTRTLGSICALSCVNGYQATSSANGTCAATGPGSAVWQNYDITCTPVNCAAPTLLPANATVGTCGGQILGTSCQLGCSDGYSVTSSAQGTCTAGTGPTASWIGQTVVCDPVSCPPLAAPANALQGTCGNKVLGSTCQFGCQTQFVATAMSTGTCTAGTGPSASWVGADITCTALGTICLVPTGLPPHVIAGTCSGGVVGTQCQLGCAGGYQPSGVTIGSCNASLPTAQWVGLDITCTPVQCTPVSLLPGYATAGTCTSRDLGEVCQLGCENGCKPSAVVNGSCNALSGANAMWQGQAITCLPASCPAAGGADLPDFAEIGTCSAAPLGAQCELDCMLGATQTGTGTLNCVPLAQGTAHWTMDASSNLVCIPGVCSPLTVLPPRGRVGTCGSLILGSTCQIACADGYVLTQAVNGTCAARGSSVIWTGADGVCESATCPPLDSLDDITSPNSAAGTCNVTGVLGQSCTLGCAEGFNVVSSVPGTCVAGVGPVAVWSGMGVTCQANAAITGAPAAALIVNNNSSNTNVFKDNMLPIILAAVGLCLIITALIIVAMYRRRKQGPAKPARGRKPTTNANFVESDATVHFRDQPNLFHNDSTHIPHVNPLFDANTENIKSLGSFNEPFVSDPDRTTMDNNPMFNPANQATVMVSPGSSAGAAASAFASGSTTMRNDTQMMSESSNAPFAIQLEDGIAVRKWDEFNVLKELGAGAFGTVYHVRERITRTDMALKMFGAVKSNEDIAAFVREANVLLNLHHQHCLACFGLVQKDQELGLLMEFMTGGELKAAAAKLNKHRKLDVLSDACKGLAYLHSRKLVHGDIKPGNILLDAAGVAKLADFGVSGTTAVGYTQRYAAPEVISGAAKPNAIADMYSFGLTIVEVFSGKPPFEKLKVARTADPTALPYAKLDDVPVRIRSTVERCLSNDPTVRPSAQDLIQVLLDDPDDEPTYL